MAVTWGSEQTETQKTAVSNSEEFFSTVDMTGALLAQVSIDVDNESGTVTDGLIVGVYLSPDGGTDWDDVPFMSFIVVPAGVTAEQHSFLIPSVATWRIGVESEGATDDYTVDVSYKLRTA